MNRNHSCFDKPGPAQGFKGYCQAWKQILDSQQVNFQELGASGSISRTICEGGYRCLHNLL